MSSTEIIAIIVAIGGVLITPVLTYLTLKVTKETALQVAQTTVSLQAVEHTVNSKQDKLLKEISDLKSRVAELVSDREKAHEMEQLRSVSDAAIRTERKVNE